MIKISVTQVPTQFRFFFSLLILISGVSVSASDTKLLPSDPSLSTSSQTTKTYQIMINQPITDFMTPNHAAPIQPSPLIVMPPATIKTDRLTTNNQKDDNPPPLVDKTVSPKTSDEKAPQKVTANTANSGKQTPTKEELSVVDQLCHEIGNTLGSVNTEQCIKMTMSDSKGVSVEQRPLVIKEFPPLEGVNSLGRVLVMGGIHGDEYSSVSLMFRWMDTLSNYHSGVFHWKMVPLLNPDGLLRKPKATRQNANGVDLNRNFPTFDWGDLAQKYWTTRTYKNPRRYPGPIAASEPETQWFMNQIQTFQPQVIIAVHAPHKLVDFDGPRQPPVKLGKLQLRRLGTYPGSLGNYGAHSLLLPVITVELASAGIMPTKKEISGMWRDLVHWLKIEVPKQRQAMLERQKRANEKAKSEGRSGLSIQPAINEDKVQATTKSGSLPNHAS